MVSRGAIVTLNDSQTAEQLQPAMKSLEKLDIHWITGGHPLELLQQAEILCLSGGIPLSLPIVQAAIHQGLEITNDAEIFLETAPCPVVGITGSAGKTTTTTLVGRMAAAALPAPHRGWVGGNIGLPLIQFVDQMQPSDLAILELSSFQLEQTRISPQYAAVLNITPNHLDRHGTMAAYTAAKSHILAYQTPDSTAVLNPEDPGSWGLRDLVKGKLVTCGRSNMDDLDGTCMLNDLICYRSHQRVEVLLPAAEIHLRGQHNLMNVLAAAALGTAIGFPPSAILTGVKDFKGVAHRLEFVREYKGARWYNDSIASAPERTMAAIRSFDEPIILLAGGRDKNLPWDTFAELVHRRVKYLIVFGEAADLIEKAVSAVKGPGELREIILCDRMHEAITAASELVQPGDVVLLSPGGTSFDEFKDFEARGEEYRRWVQQLS